MEKEWYSADEGSFSGHGGPWPGRGGVEHTGSCVSIRQTTTLVVRGLGREFLCLSVCLRARWRTPAVALQHCTPSRKSGRRGAHAGAPLECVGQPPWSSVPPLRRLGCGCGRRLLTGSCVLRETTSTAVRGLGCAALCAPACLPACLSRRGSPTAGSPGPDGQPHTRRDRPKRLEAAELWRCQVGALIQRAAARLLLRVVGGAGVASGALVDEPRVLTPLVLVDAHRGRVRLVAPG